MSMNTEGNLRLESKDGRDAIGRFCKASFQIGHEIPTILVREEDKGYSISISSCGATTTRYFDDLTQDVLVEPLRESVKNARYCACCKGPCARLVELRDENKKLKTALVKTALASLNEKDGIEQ